LIKSNQEMTRLDRFIQSWRINVTKRYIPRAARVLDIGCADGALFRLLSYLSDGVGIDPEVTPQHLPNAQLVRGLFPADLPDDRPFDAITMLAVLEHIQPALQPQLAQDCFDHLRPRGRLIITVPSPATDHVLSVLKALKLIHGISLEQHYGYDVGQTPRLFGSAGFHMIRSSKFQLGFNNLFVFERP
jgi:2-polyprenyl-3-methyl-5-hydroxy-6-metoxy-1,4-benzoquinol methylase